MNADRFVLLAALLAMLGADKPNGKTAAPAVPSLIRKEWLKPPAGPAAPPRRDIFSPQGGAFVDPERRPDPAVRPGAKPAADKSVEEEAQPTLALRYLGFSRVVASKKIVALVLVDGQAAAVEEGEAVGAGYKILKITSKEIEVQGPDGRSLTFPREGAER